MILGDLSISDLDEMIREINAKLKQGSKSSSELLDLRRRLEAMKIDLVGLADLREDFEGEISRMKTIVYRARN